MPEPLLCVTVVGRTMEELRRARDTAAHADLVEVRLDRVDRPDAAGALEGRHRPVIVTCRARWEGGGFEGSEEERHRILAEAVAAGAEFVDVEARAEFVPAILRARRGRGRDRPGHQRAGRAAARAPPPGRIAPAGQVEPAAAGGRDRHHRNRDGGLPDPARRDLEHVALGHST